MTTAGMGGVFYFDLEDINPKVITSSFTTISSQSTGGVFEINKLKILTLD